MKDGEPTAFSQKLEIFKTIKDLSETPDRDAVKNRIWTIVGVALFAYWAVSDIDNRLAIALLGAGVQTIFPYASNLVSSYLQKRGYAADIDWLSGLHNDAVPSPKTMSRRRELERVKSQCAAKCIVAMLIITGVAMTVVMKGVAVTFLVWCIFTGLAVVMAVCYKIATHESNAALMAIDMTTPRRVN